MDEPQEYLVIISFLRHEVTRAHERARSLRKGYTSLEQDWGINKQNLMKLESGRTVGIHVFFVLKDKRWGGSMDAMSLAAKRWWAGLTEEARQQESDWIQAKHEARTAPKRGRTVEDRQEIARLELDEAERQATAHTRRSSPPSGPHKTPNRRR